MLHCVTRDLTNRGDLDGQPLFVRDQAEGLWDLDPRDAVGEACAAAEVRPRLGAFQGDVAEDLRGLGRMRLDEILRPVPPKFPERIDAVGVPGLYCAEHAGADEPSYAI